MNGATFPFTQSIETVAVDLCYDLFYLLIKALEFSKGNDFQKLPLKSASVL